MTRLARPASLASFAGLLALSLGCGGGGEGEPCYSNSDCAFQLTCYRTDLVEPGICTRTPGMEDTDMLPGDTSTPPQPPFPPGGIPPQDSGML